MLYRGYEIIISTLCKDFISAMYFYFICLNKQRLFWYGMAFRKYDYTVERRGECIFVTIINIASSSIR